MGQIKDMTGMKFGKLTVIEFAGIKNTQALWRCQCECGNVTVVIGQSLRNGNTASCGCLFREHNQKRWYRHGESHTRLHKLWNGMIQRCNDNKSRSYPRYGGRGVKVCNEWLVYENFRDWAVANGYDESAPYRECTLDRIDNDGNYEPTNCRWVKWSEQVTNKSTNHYFTYRGETMTISQWSKITGIAYHTLLYRIQQNWDEKRVFHDAKHYI